MVYLNKPITKTISMYQVEAIYYRIQSFFIYRNNMNLYLLINDYIIAAAVIIDKC